MIPDHDILLAGFPCQPFSLSGIAKRKSLGMESGFDDKIKGTLFFDILRILKSKKPKLFLLENVKNIKSHDNGKTFSTIMDSLDKLGYFVSVKTISSRYWVPQIRNRVFFAGTRKNESLYFSLSDIKFPDTNHKLASILHPENGSEFPEYKYTYGPQAKVNEKYILKNKTWNCLKSHKEKHNKIGNGFGYSLVGPDSVARTLSARYGRDGSEILINRQGNPRRLTPRECSRLMGFDSFRKWKIPVSDMQAYRQFGNAVVPQVSLAIAQAMRPWLGKNQSHPLEESILLPLFSDIYGELYT